MAKLSLTRLSPLVLASAVALGACFTACMPSSPQGEELEASESAIELNASQTLPGKSVLLLPFIYDIASDTTWLKQNADRLAKWYRGKGATAEVVSIAGMPDDPTNGIYAVLEGFAQSGTKFDRIITLGHGGFDGPIYGEAGQIGLDWPEDPYAIHLDDGGTTLPPNMTEDEFRAEVRTRNRAKLVELAGLIAKVTTEDAFVYLGQCNPGNKTDIEPTLTYVELTACLTGRVAYGTSSQTSGDDIANRVMKLEGPTPTMGRALTVARPGELPADTGAISCVAP